MDDEVTATKIIPDLKRIELLKAAQQYFDKRKRLGKLGVPLLKYLGNPAYQFGDGQKPSYIMLTDDQGRVVYFVKYKRISHDEFSLGRQVLLVADSTRRDVNGGFARFVFFNVLMPKYTALIADQQQTIMGRQFWINAIGAALDNPKYHVYAYDRRSRQSELTAIKTMEDLEAHRSVLWGFDAAHELTFPVISLKPLALKHQS